MPGIAIALAYLGIFGRICARVKNKINFVKTTVISICLLIHLKIDIRDYS